MTLFVDTRYQGHHGIARYAREVLARLALPFDPLPVHRTPTSPGAYLERGWRIPLASDVIYSPGFGTGRSRSPQLLTVHDLIHLEGDGPAAAAHRLYYERAVKPAIRRSGHVFTVSPTSADAIRQWLRDDSVLIHDTANGCDPAFTPDGPRHDHPRPYLVYVGNAKSHKNPAAALGALRRLEDFDLIAVTSDIDAFRSLAEREGVGARLHTVSGVDDATLATYYRGAAALVFPSLVEGFGLPVLEALKCGTNVVFSATAATVADICQGTQFDVGDPHDHGEFAARIEEAARSPFQKPADLSRYDWDLVAGRVREVLGSCR